MESRARDYLRKDSLFSACGLNCCLCPRFNTEGESRCPGCGADGFSQKHPACGVLSCSIRHGVEFCGLCGEYPCKKYDGVDRFDSFITHQNQFKNFARIKETDFEVYKIELERKALILNELLQQFDDGRKKSYFCLAVNLLELGDIEFAMVQLEQYRQDSPKEKAAAAAGLFDVIAQKRGIILKLRKSEPKSKKETERKMQ